MMEGQSDSGDAITVVLCTFPDETTACQIGTKLLESQLCACMNIVPGMKSIFRWEGKIQRENEVLGILKTTREKVNDLEGRIQKEHPYAVPEILVLPVLKGAKPYLEWVRNSLA